MMFSDIFRCKKRKGMLSNTESIVQKTNKGRGKSSSKNTLQKRS